MDESPKVGWYDKTRVVVIDFGYKYTKIGIGGEANPRFILPSTTVDHVPVFDTEDANGLYDRIANFLHFLYFKRLLINPKETKVVVVENLLDPSILRKTLAKVLFGHLDVLAVLFVPSHMVALYPLAAPTAISIDLGFREVCVMPVFEGYPLINAYQALPIGSRAVEREVRRLLLEHYSDKDPSKVPTVNALTDETIEDIIASLCFVAPKDKVSRPDKDATRPPNVEFPLPDRSPIVIPGSVREDACEVLFIPDIDGASLPTMVLDSILKCPVDMRKPLSENLLLFGGTAMIKGLRKRLEAEILELIKSDCYKEKLILEEVKMYRSPSMDNCTAWLGGSLLGASETITMRAVSKEEFSKTQDVPDWASLKYNIKGDEARRGFSSRLL